MAGKKCDGKEEHQDGANYPVLDQRKSQDFEISKYLAQLLVLHLCQRRIHHENQADGDRDIGGANLKLVYDILDTWLSITAAHTDKHGQKDPESKIAVEEGKTPGN